MSSVRLTAYTVLILNINYILIVYGLFNTDRDIDRNNHTGLGLPIVREIIRSFRGFIRIIKSDRAEYSGACFIINLPLKNDQKT